MSFHAASCFFELSVHHQATPAARINAMAAAQGQRRRLFPDEGTAFVSGGIPQ